MFRHPLGKRAKLQHESARGSSVEATIIQSTVPTMSGTFVKPISPGYRILLMSIEVIDGAEVVQAWDRANPLRDPSRLPPGSLQLCIVMRDIGGLGYIGP